MGGGTSGPHARRMRRFVGAMIAVALPGICPASAEAYLVKDQDAYRQAVQRLEPGDKLVLANGVWRDFEIVFEAYGEEGKPISLMAESPGKVIISGRSNLRIGGEHLVVHGLTFKNGYSPSNEVISFRLDSDTLAHRSRLSEVVIDGFNKPNRTDEDQWVTLFGKNNRVDHSYFAGKTNKGPTLVVRLNAEESRENGHIIDHNFFGHRPTLGGNGGETIRIGVSDYSRTRSETVISRNYFERCDGEVEIISIKSEGNAISENTFYESRGSVVFRHGGNNEASRNVFLGNGVSDTGGVRVINENQTIKENYFEGLRGEKFLSALTIMNGVPNSPINRYHQVKSANVSQNSFIDFNSIGLAVGSDEERSAAPADSAVTNNLFITDASSPVSVFDDISGIRFGENVSGSQAMEAFGSIIDPEIELVRAENGLLYPAGDAYQTVGAPRDLDPVKRQNTGPAWFEKPPQSPDGAREKRVKKGAAALRRAVAESRPGDVFTLQGKRYDLEQALEISHAITIQGRSRDGQKTILRSEGASIFEIAAHGGLTLNKVELVGSLKNESVIVARGDSYEGDYTLKLNDVDASVERDLSELPFLAAEQATFAKSIAFERVSAAGWPGTFISLSGADLDGWYLADDIKIIDSTFTNFKGSLIEFGREGRDESTFGPRVIMENSSLSQINPGGVAVALDGVDGLSFGNNEIRGSGQIRIKKRVLGLKFVVEANELEKTPAPEILGVNGEPLALSKIDGSH